MNYQNCNHMAHPMPCAKPMPPKDIFKCDVPLAMAYVPMQIWNTTYELDKALHVGTIFPYLDKPFMGRCMCK